MAAGETVLQRPLQRCSADVVGPAGRPPLPRRHRLHPVHRADHPQQARNRLKRDAAER